MNYSEMNRKNRRLHLEMEEKFNPLKPVREKFVTELFRYCSWFVIAILSLFILMPKGN